MERRTLLKGIAASISSLYISKSYAGRLLKAPYAAPAFQPTWDSLAQYQVPNWFRDAKFGMWAHWGPQCQPERGDWYARGMYQEGSDQYRFHCQKYGHPSKFGFKDVINEWKAENWNPDELIGLYKRAGAKYFMALANHHDNFDLYHSTHQPWNSTRMGPKKDLIRGWANAAKKHDLPFGVSIHAAHAWSWMEPSQRSDRNGQLTGVPYDGKLTKADGDGKWWHREDPQELYAQNHPLSKDSLNNGTIHSQWNWGNGVTPPSAEYCEKFYKRTLELIDKYGVEMLYFDDTALPLWPVSDAGLRIAAHMYNTSIKKHGKLNAVIFGKILNEQQRKCMVWDIERGQSNQIESFPWQTDTCIGGWHYDRRIYENGHYKSAKTIIQTLVDIVSKNGNLLLNIPVRGDGTIDDKERMVVEGIADWMHINSESIYGTRPWKIFGEGPAIAASAPLNAQGFNEGKGKPFGPEDIRFATKGKVLYATMFGWPANQKATIKALNANAGRVDRVTLLSNGQKLNTEQTADGLVVNLPDQQIGENAFVFKIEGSII
jgi:alpha-L-fucosidase